MNRENKQIGKSSVVNQLKGLSLTAGGNEGQGPIYENLFNVKEQVARVQEQLHGSLRSGPPPQYGVVAGGQRVSNGGNLGGGNMRGPSPPIYENIENLMRTQGGDLTGRDEQMKDDSAGRSTSTVRSGPPPVVQPAQVQAYTSVSRAVQKNEQMQASAPVVKQVPRAGSSCSSGGGGLIPKMKLKKSDVS